jgi:hypothetical protein
MKYLKRFNEELSPGVYKNAARKLDKLVKEKPILARAVNAEKRKGNLEEHSKKIEKIEDMKKWRNNIETFSKYGEFNIELGNPRNSSPLSPKVFTFYLYLSISADMMEDSWDDEDTDNREILFPFVGGLIPKNEEDIPQIEEYIPDEMYNGFFWGFWINIIYKVSEGVVSFDGLKIYDYDDYLINMQFADRKSVVKFKNLVTNLFDYKFDYPSGHTDVTNMYDKIEQSLVQGLEISSTYGVDMGRIKEDIKNTPIMSFYKQ